MRCRSARTSAGRRCIRWMKRKRSPSWRPATARMPRQSPRNLALPSTTASSALSWRRWACRGGGGRELVVGARGGVKYRLEAVDTPGRELAEKRRKKPAKSGARREKLEAAAEKIGDGDKPRLNRLATRFEKLGAEREKTI